MSETASYPKSVNPNPTSKKNFIQLTGLSPKQRDLLVKGGITLGSVAGAGALILSLSSADSSGATQNTEPVIHKDAPIATKVSDDDSFDMAFHHARTEVGPGGIFTWNGNEYNTYYKEEWDAMSKNQKEEFLSSVPFGKGHEYENHDCEACCTVEIPTDFEMAKGINDSMPFNEAFDMAREQCGMNGLFNWHGNTYNTLLKDEYDQFTTEQKQDFYSSVQHSSEWKTLIIEDTSTGQQHVDDFHTGFEGDHIQEMNHYAFSEHHEEYVAMDINHDHAIETVVGDINDDGFADIVAVDSDGNALPEHFFINSDDNHSLDSLIIDFNENGMDENDVIAGIGEHEVDMYNINSEHLPSDDHSVNHIEHNQQDDFHSPDHLDNSHDFGFDHI